MVPLAFFNISFDGHALWTLILQSWLYCFVIYKQRYTVVPSYHLHGHNLQNVSTAKYLGVNIQDNLNWGLHIDTITNKANKTLGFLRRNLQIVTTIDFEYLPQPTETRSSHRKNNTHGYNIPYCRTQYRQMSFFPRTIPEWNSLPQEIVAAKSLDCFKSRLAAHL